MGKQFKESTQQNIYIKGGKANQGVPRDFSISYSDELEFQSNFNLQVGLVQFHILLHHCQLLAILKPLAYWMHKT